MYLVSNCNFITPCAQVKPVSVAGVELRIYLI
jgi:hypothetical protein